MKRKTRVLQKTWRSQRILNPSNSCWTWSFCTTVYSLLLRRTSSMWGKTWSLATSTHGQHELLWCDFVSKTSGTRWWVKRHASTLVLYFLSVWKIEGGRRSCKSLIFVHLCFCILDELIQLVFFCSSRIMRRLISVFSVNTLMRPAFFITLRKVFHRVKQKQQKSVAKIWHPQLRKPASPSLISSWFATLAFFSMSADKTISYAERSRLAFLSAVKAFDEGNGRKVLTCRGGVER